jgi:DNA-binding LytR/AlgR family response regulator
MFNLLICESDENSMKTLYEYISYTFNELNLEFNVSTYILGKDLLSDSKTLKESDIIFLDTELKDYSGIEIAKNLREKNILSEIIFISNIPDKINSSYSVNPYVFLLKPFKYDLFNDIIKKCINTIFSYKKNLFEITFDNNEYIFSYNDILYIESYDRRITIYTVNGSFELNKRTSFKSLFSKLPKNMFFRCHKSYIINLFCFKVNDDKKSIIINDVTIPVAKEKFSQLLLLKKKLPEQIKIIK